MKLFKEEGHLKMGIPLRIGCKFCQYEFSAEEREDYINHLWRFHRDDTQKLLDEIIEEIHKSKEFTNLIVPKMPLFKCKFFKTCGNKVERSYFRKSRFVCFDCKKKRNLKNAIASRERKIG